MFAKSSIIRRLWLLSGFLILIVAGLGAFSLIQSSRLFAMVDHTANRQVPAVRHMVTADMLHDGLRAVVIEGYLASIKKDQKRINELVAEAKEKSKEFHEHLAKIENLGLSDKIISSVQQSKPSLTAYTELSIEIVSLLDGENYQLAEDKKSVFDESFSKLETDLENLGGLIEAEANQVSTSGSNVLFITATITVMGTILGLLLSIISLRHLRRSVSHFLSHVVQNSGNISEASERLVVSNQNLTASVTESSASLQETVASLEEVSSMVKLNSDNARKASEVSVNSRISAELGEKNISELQTAMREINASSKKMEEIISVIDEIAFQTNLLALNAAVEAARAGEQGRGFAVVAEAVRSLAQRSAGAAKDISQMIKESVVKIEKGSHIVTESREALVAIFDSVKQIAELNQQIANASEEQSSGIRQISEAMNQIDAATQQNAHSAHELAAVTNTVVEQVSDLDKTIGDLQVQFLGEKVSEKSKDEVKTKVLPFKKPTSDDFFADSNVKSSEVKVAKLSDF